MLELIKFLFFCNIIPGPLLLTIISTAVHRGCLFLCAGIMVGDFILVFVIKNGVEFFNLNFRASSAIYFKKVLILIFLLNAIISIYKDIKNWNKPKEEKDRENSSKTKVKDFLFGLGINLLDWESLTFITMLCVNFAKLDKLLYTIPVISFFMFNAFGLVFRFIPVKVLKILKPIASLVLIIFVVWFYLV